MLLWILIGIIVCGLFYLKLVKPHSYWSKHGVPQRKTVPLFGDGWKTVFRLESFPEGMISLYNSFPNSRYIGTYQMVTPALVIKDPELIKQMVIKDFDHFADHVQFFTDDFDPLWTRSLFSLNGDNWRSMRATLSPAFTGSKMKAMFVLMTECGEQLVKHFEAKNEEITVIELKDTFTRFANDVIATTAFGVKCDSLGERENEFYLMGKDATDFASWGGFFRFVMFFLFPKFAKLLGIKLFTKRTYNFFKNLITETVKTREANNIVRPDMIHLMMEAQKGRLVHEVQTSVKETGFAVVEESDVGKSTKGKVQITLDDMLAQAVFFFFAGFDSVSTLLCFMGYELGVNPDIQEKLRKEVDDTLKECNGNITYEALHKMKYLDMVVAESLRKWPPTVAGDRRCTKPYVIQATNPSETNVYLRKDDLIAIPTWGLQRDPNLYPNPERFDPERFSDENKHNINQYAYVPFSTGPRACIGSRLALMEAKTAFFYILSKFEIVVVEKTEVPCSLSKKGFNVMAEGGMWFGLKKRQL